MERFVRRAGVWLVLVVMAAMAFCGCKGKSKFADVKDEDFEKTGYYFGTKRRMSQYGYLQSVTDYYYVIKNNSDQKVAIIGNATIHGVNGDILYEGKRDIPVLGPGETSFLKYTVWNADVEHIDHIDCELQYYNTELTPVIGNIWTEAMRSEDKLTYLVTNRNNVEVQDLSGVVLFFDTENNVIATDEIEFKDINHSVFDVMKPGTSRAAMFVPANYKRVLAEHEYKGYDHAELFLKYLEGYSEDIGKKSRPFIDIPEDTLQVKEIHCKNTEGYQIHCLAIKNISDQTIGVHGVMKAYDADDNPLTALTSTADALAPGEETLLPFEFDVFDPLKLWLDYYGDYVATDAIKNADHVSYTLTYDPHPDRAARSYSTHIIDYDLGEYVFKEVLVTYHGDGTILRPRVYGVFYDSEGNIVLAGYARGDSFNGGRSDEFVVKDTMENGDTVIYGFSTWERWFCDKETGDRRPMPEYERADLYIIDN